VFGIVAQDEPDLADGGVDAVLDIEENVFAPEALGDFFAGNELTLALGEKDEELHGELFDTQNALALLQDIARVVEYEVAEMELLGRRSLARSLLPVEK